MRKPRPSLAVRVLAFLVEQYEPVTAPQVAKAVRARHPATCTVLKRLQDRKQAVSVGKDGRRMLWVAL